MKIRKFLCFKYCRIGHYNISVTIFNVPVYRKYERNGYPYIEFFGIRKKISNYKRLQRALKDARNFLKVDFKKVILLSNHSGEMSLLISEISDQIRLEKETIFIVTRPYHQQFVELFAKGIPCFLCPEIGTVHMDPHVESEYLIDGVSLRIPGPLNYFIELEREMRTKPICELEHFYKRFMKTFLPVLGYLPNKTPSTPVIDPKTKDDFERRLKMLDLSGKRLIILSPDSVSNIALPVNFWQKLSIALYEKGFACVFNVMRMCPEAKFGYILPTNYTEAMILAEKAECIIGLRSGFFDVVASRAKRMIAVYTDFRFRLPTLPEVRADRVHQTFTLTKLPYRPDVISEIVLTNIYIKETDSKAIEKLVADVLSALD